MSPGQRRGPGGTGPRESLLAGEDSISVPHRLPETPALDAMSAGLRDFADGYAAGFLTGSEIGTRQGEAAEAQLWSEALGILRQTANRPLQAELVVRRAEDPTDPCPARCRRCSRCIRSVAWWGRGGRDYAGTGQENAQIRAALAASAQRARTAEAAREATAYGLAAGG